MTYKEQLEARLRLLESDLKDSHNPQILAKYPHLGRNLLVVELKARILEVKRLLEEHMGVRDTQSRDDMVVEAVRADLLRRSQIGIAKYGVTLERTDLSLKDWLQHAYEETLDQANYLKRAIFEIEHLDKKEKDNENKSS